MTGRGRKAPGRGGGHTHGERHHRAHPVINLYAQCNECSALINVTAAFADGAALVETSCPDCETDLVVEQSEVRVVRRHADSRPTCGADLTTGRS